VNARLDVLEVGDNGERITTSSDHALHFPTCTIDHAPSWSGYLDAKKRAAHSPTLRFGTPPNSGKLSLTLLVQRACDEGYASIMRAGHYSNWAMWLRHVLLPLRARK
jgi:hypothetical protein